MKAHLLYRERDLDWKWILQASAERESARGGRRHYRDQNFDPGKGLPWNADAISADLSLGTIFDAMARGDDCVFEASRKVILTAGTSDLETIRHRQGILRDCLSHPTVVRELYAVAVEVGEKQKGNYLGVLARYPDSVLRNAVEQMEVYLEFLQKLRRIADSHGPRFASEGWTTFFAMLARDLDDGYLALVRRQLEELKFRHGALLSAELGKANKGVGHILHRVLPGHWSLRRWWTGLFEDKGTVYRFDLHPRDEAGSQALAALRNRGISLAANALGQSADHVRDFWGMLRAELAFYVGCINLAEELARRRMPACLPIPAAADGQVLSFRELYDVGLALSVDQPVIGNDACADGKNLVVITGPNTGGKSTFLRSVGLAQLMMQSGMFVSAEAFSASLCDGLFTHFKREEDAGMESGKLDEELGRMSDIVGRIAPHALLLLNESFAATNEREGSEIGRQIISALLQRRIRVLCVTHMYELAHGFLESHQRTGLFLRAERKPDGARTFKLREGEPLPTSFGEDLYNSIFGPAASSSEAERPMASAAAR